MNLKSLALTITCKYLPNNIRKYMFANLFHIAKEHETIEKHVYITYPPKLEIGDNGYINHHVVFNAGATNTEKIIIGDRVWIAPYVHFYCVSHEIGTHEQRAGENIYKSIVVKDGAWIGANSVILGGVTIGAGAVIGANSLVLKDVPDDELWAGNPAKFIRKLDN